MDTGIGVLLVPMLCVVVALLSLAAAPYPTHASFQTPDLRNTTISSLASFKCVMPHRPSTLILYALALQTGYDVMAIL